MTIEKGADWGSRGTPPPDLRICDDPLDALDIVTEARRANRAVPPIGLRTGDLVRTLGGPTTDDLATATDALNVDVDLGAVLLDGTLHWFLAHLIARRSWLRGRVLVAANAAFIGGWNVAPRSHPADGRLDTLELEAMSLGARWQARGRLRTGSHVPHPQITTRRASAVQYEFDRPIPIHLDGRRVGSARTVSLRVEPDAVSIWI